MPRRKRVVKREILPDPKYHDVVVAKFVNNLMRKGKKSTAEHILYGALDRIQEKTKQDGIEVLRKALNNVGPAVEVKSRRVGGSTYQVPGEVEAARGISLASRWLLAAARTRAGRSMADRLAAEFIDAATGQGTADKKKEETHRMAEANRAFASYRW